VRDLAQLFWILKSAQLRITCRLGRGQAWTSALYFADLKKRIVRRSKAACRNQAAGQLRRCDRCGDQLGSVWARGW
jgi:hypothetical protein